MQSLMRLLRCKKKIVSLCVRPLGGREIHLRLGRKPNLGIEVREASWNAQIQFPTIAKVKFSPPKRHIHRKILYIREEEKGKKKIYLFRK
jgi:2-iminoacetate synthase ThiH